MERDPRQTGSSRRDPENPNHDLSEQDVRKSQGLDESVGKTPGSAEGDDPGERRDRPYPNEPRKTPGRSEG